MFWIAVVILSLGGHSIESTDSVANQRTTEDVNPSLPHEDVFALIQEIVDKQIPYASLQKFEELSKDALEAKDLRLFPMSLKEFDKFFEKIIKIGFKLPDYMVTFLWKLFAIHYAANYTNDWENPSPTISTPYASLFFAQKFTTINTDLLQNENSRLKFQDMILDNADSLLTDVRINDFSDLPIKNYMDILISSFGDETFKVKMMEQLFNHPNALDLLKKYDDSFTVNFKNSLFVKILKSQNNWLSNAKLILNILKNSNALKLTTEEENFVQDALSKVWVLRKLPETLSQDIKENAFEREYSNFLREYEGQKLTNDIIEEISQCLMNNQIPLEDRKIIFSKTIQGFSGKEISYLIFALKNWRSEVVLDALRPIQFKLRALFPDVVFDKSQLEQIKGSINFLSPEVSLKFKKSNLLGFYNSLKRAYFKNSLKFIDDTTPAAEVSEKMTPILPILYNDNIQAYSDMIFSDLPGLEFEKAVGKNYSRSSAAFEKVIYNQEGYTRDKSGTEITGFPESGGNIEKSQALSLKKGGFIVDTATPNRSLGLLIDQDIPIGYNIHLPKGKIKAVLVKAYGAFGPSEMESALDRPGRIGSFDSYLLNQGIAIVTLNLLNFLDPMMDVNWSAMPEDLHAKLHASINKFFDSIRGKDSEKVLHGLIPENAKMYLYGGSFGGRTAVRHAELYPNTFDGYISHDGWISLGMAESSDLPALNKRATAAQSVLAREWLSPMGTGKIDLIQQPILLLHNFDDNNVNIKVSLDFYQAALTSGKENLVDFLITRRGNPMPGKSVGSYNKGHFPTEDEQAFKSYAGTIASFILGGLPKSPTVRKWMAYQYEIYANKNYRAATFEEQFISKAYRLYKAPMYRAIPAGAVRTTLKHEDLMAGVEVDTAEKSPLQERLESGEQEASQGSEMAVNPLKIETPAQRHERTKNWNVATEEEAPELLSGAPVLGEPRGYKPSQGRVTQARQDQQNQDAIKFENFWVNEGRPLYYTLKYLDSLRGSPLLFSEINEIKNQNIVTNESIQKALFLQLPNFLDYVRENFGYPLPYDMDLSVFSQDKNLQDKFRSLLFKDSLDGNLKVYLLQSFYIGNQNLLKQRLSQLTKERKFVDTLKLNAGEILEAKENLRQRILLDKEFAIKRLAEIGNLQEHIQTSFDRIYALDFQSFEEALKKKTEHTSAWAGMTPYVTIIKLINPIFADDNVVAQKYRVKILNAYEESVTSHASISGVSGAKNYTAILLSLALVKGDKDFMKEALIKSVDVLKTHWKKTELHTFVIKFILHFLLKDFPASKLNDADIEAIWDELGYGRD